MGCIAGGNKIMKTLLQELELITDIPDSKSKTDLDWADGSAILGEKLELFLPENKKYLDPFLEASGSVGPAKWFFFDMNKIYAKYSFDDIAVRDVAYGRSSRESKALIDKDFGGNRKVGYQLINMVHDYVKTGAHYALVVIVSDKVHAFVTFEKPHHSVSYSVETAISKGGAVKLHDIYADLIKQEDVIITSSSQSEGGINLWMRLSKVPGIVVHGWDKKNSKPINLGPSFTDPEETHVSPSDIYGTAALDREGAGELGAEELEDLKHIHRSVILVASKKKRGKK